MSNIKNVVLALNHQSAVIIKQHKKLLIFPIINHLISLCLFAIALIPLLKFEEKLWTTQQVTRKEILILSVCFFGFFTIMHLCNLTLIMALSVCTLDLFQKQTFQLTSGFRFATRHIWSIFKWKIVMNSVGGVYRFCTYWIDDWSQNKIGRYLLEGMPWFTGVFFIIPVLVTEKLGTFASMKRSAQLVMQTYGKQVVFRYRMSRVFLVIRVLVLLPIIITLIIDDKVAILIGIVCSIFLFLSTDIAFACTQGILVCGLYLHAMGVNVSDYFEVDLLKRAFSPVKT